LWQFIAFTNEVRSELGIVAPHLLVANLHGTDNAALSNFAPGWGDPSADTYYGFRRVPKCLEPNIQIRREFTAEAFEEVYSATATSPPRQVRELTEEVCSAFGRVEPVLFDSESGAFVPQR
jgi:hypothetical protein